jgi:hypothetical protein
MHRAAHRACMVLRPGSAFLSEYRTLQCRTARRPIRGQGEQSGRLHQHGACVSSPLLTDPPMMGRCIAWRTGSTVMAKPTSGQTNQQETAMIKYRTVHTGTNSRFGGRQDGSARCSYHSPGRNTAPPKAATKQATTKPNSASRERASISLHLSQIGRWPNAMDVAQAISSARNSGATSNSGTAMP